MCFSCDSGIPQPSCYGHNQSKELDFDQLFLQASLDLGFYEQDPMSDFSSGSSSASSQMGSPDSYTLPLLALDPTLLSRVTAQTKENTTLSPMDLHIHSSLLLPTHKEQSRPLSLQRDRGPSSVSWKPLPAARTPSQSIISEQIIPEPLTVITDDPEESLDEMDVDEDSDDEYDPNFNSPTSRSTTTHRRLRPSRRSIKGKTTPKSRSSVSKKPSVSKKIDWLICKVCNHRQDPKRRPDFKRHMRIHEEKSVFCCGVLLDSEEAKIRGLTREDAYEWEGEIRVGGCKTSFARTDSLHRHLRNEKVSCLY